MRDKRRDTVKLLRAARLFDPIYAARCLGNDPKYEKALQLVEDLNLYDALNNDVFIRKIKSEVPSYIKEAELEVQGVPTKLASDPLTFHYRASGKDMTSNLLTMLNGRPFMYEAAKKLALLQPTSATAERLNSILDARFGKRRRRGATLSDMITASLMLWQNRRDL